jgi:ribonuclease inhibitor
MSRVVLDGDEIDSLGDVHDTLARELGFPAYYGRNLDGLWDVLTADVAVPVEIHWRNSATSRTRLGEDFEKIAEILQDAAKTRRGITVTFE